MYSPVSRHELRNSRSIRPSFLHLAAILGLLVLGFLLSGCPMTEDPVATATPSPTMAPSNPSDVGYQTNMVVYEVLPYRWTAPYFVSIKDDLPRIRNLGFNTLWFTPLYPGDGIGYHAIDYTSVNPDFGTGQQLKDLVNQAHALGFKVILDQVFNHTDYLHPWFQDCLTNKAASPYIDYYLWNGEKGIAANAQKMYSGTGSWGELPNLNVANPAVQTALIDSSKYWLNTYGFDGFRCDVAWGVEQRASTFWKEWRSQLLAINPDLFLLGEAPTTPTAGNYEDVGTLSGSDKSLLFQDRFDALYDWELRAFDDTTGLPAALAGTVSLDTLNACLTKSYPAGKLPFRFIENHDTGRAAALPSGIPGSKLAHALVLTVPGVPLVFAGAENGQTSQFERVCTDTGNMGAWITRLLEIRAGHIPNASSLIRVPNDQAATVYSYALYGSRNHMTVVVLNFAGASATAALDLSGISPYITSSTGLTDLMTSTALDAGAISLGAYGVKIFDLERNATAFPADFGAVAGPNLVQNGDFSSGPSSWNSNMISPASAWTDTTSNAYTMNILAGGTETWHLQLVQGALPLENGKTYTLGFTASATANRSIVALLRKTDYTQYASRTFNLTSTPTACSLTFTMTAASDSAAELVIEMGGADASVTLDDFTLTGI